MKHPSLQQYEYHVWANNKMFAHLKELPEDIYLQEVQSVFPSIAALLVHMYNTDSLWLCAMSGYSYDEIVESMKRAADESKGKTLLEIEQLFNKLPEKYRAFFNEHNMETYSSYPHPRFGTLEARYCDILQHIVNHGTYHRGNLSAMLRQLGHAGTPNDYVFYLYEMAGK